MKVGNRTIWIKEKNMWFEELNIPKDITNAQQDGSLIIFAGAGVSKANPPSLFFCFYLSLHPF